MTFTKTNKKRVTAFKRAITFFMLFTILNQIISPSVALALTAGPTAPEATNFEPIDTTDMVNPLTGDFTYNMPLLEVPGPEGGYPLSLSYHAGIQPNEEASWVGLGWSLNPGAIARNVNGYPDDWSGASGNMSNYWSGGSQQTYSVGVNIGIAGLASVSAGLSFAQDTYKGFGVGSYLGVGVGIKNSPFDIGVKIGVSPYGDSYVGLDAGIKGGGADLGGLMASANIGVQTNFKSTSAGFSGGISEGETSLLGASISTSNIKPSLSVGLGSKTSVNNINAGTISTEVDDWAITIPIYVFSVSLGYQNIRYWSNTSSDFTANGVLNNRSSITATADLNNSDDDNYSLLDPVNTSIVDNSDPLSVMGGTFPNFDNYIVTGQGLGGNMRPYSYSSILFNQNRINVNDHSNEVYTEKFPANATPNPIGKKWQFRFINDKSNSYQQEHLWSSDQTFSFDGNPHYGNSDGNYGYDPSTNRLEGTSHIEYFTNAQIIDGTSAQRGFIDCQDASGFDRTTANISIPNQIGGFMITNSSGVTYHYALPVYNSNEINHTQKIDLLHNSDNSSTLTKNVPYAYTWYLTAITGPDYVSRGTTPGIISKNDWGYWIKFDYGKWVDDYRWRNPSEGFNRDLDTQFESYSSGSKEVYYLDAVETRTHTALFVKEIRADAKCLGSNGFEYYNFTQSSHLGDDEPKASLRLNNILIVPNSSLTSSLTAIRTASKNYDYADWIRTRDGVTVPMYTQHGSSVIDINDLSQLSENLNQKCIRKIQFNYDYSLCPGTPNSYDAGGQMYATSPATEPTGGLLGKLTLLSVDFQGKGGVPITPPTQFQYDFDPIDPKNQGMIAITGTTPNATGSQHGTISTQTSNSFKIGDILSFQIGGISYYCTLLSTTDDGNNYNVLFLNDAPGLATNIHALKTKNPPYNKDAYDNWGCYKSDYIPSPSGNENLSRLTTLVSNKSTDVWSLKKIRSAIGADIAINYEGDTYNKSVLNENRSLIINTTLTSNGVNSYTFSVNNEGIDLNSVYHEGDKINIILQKYIYSDIGVPEYVIQNPFSIINSESYPTPAIIQSINNNNTLTIKVDPKMNNDMISTAGFHYYTASGQTGTTANGSPNHAVLIRGNIRANGAGMFYGGGLRVKDITVNDLNGQIKETVYNYGELGYPSGETSSSGVTTYEPLIFDQDQAFTNVNYASIQLTGSYYGPLTMYRRELYKNNNKLLAIAHELPSPGVMYASVKVSDYSILSDGSAIPIDGSTIYQYETFKPEMIGLYQYFSEPAYSNSTGGILNPEGTYWHYSNSGSGYKIVTNAARDISIKDYTSRIGALKRIITYDNIGNKLTEKINHYLHDGLDNTNYQNQVVNYESRLSSYSGVAYNNMGVIKERYGTARAITDPAHISISNPSNNQYDEVLIMSNKETFPSFLTGITQIDYKNGTTMDQQNLAYDFYTGAVTKTLTTDSYGNRFINQITPAYMAGGTSSLVYPALGLKTHDDNPGAVQHKQMLTQQASSYTFSVDINNNPIGVVTASVQTWSNVVPVLDPDNNVTTLGQSNIWRMEKGFSWMVPGTSANNLTPYASFLDYYSSGGSSNPSWKKTNQITQYNVYSAGLEATDINNNYAATRMGYDNSKVLITANNANYNEIAYAGAEDNLLSNGNLSNNISLGSATVVTDPANAHTGIRSLRLVQGGGIYYTVPKAKIRVQNYSVSIWVKTSDGSVPQASLYYQEGTVTTGPVQTNSKTAGGWYLMEMTIPASAIEGTGNLLVGVISNTPVTMYFDDFRFQPTSSISTAYVYDNQTGELSYVLDNNNLYTHYQYDAIGRLTSVSKEVLGKAITPVIKTISYNYWKLHTTSSVIYARIEYSNLVSNGSYNQGSGTNPDFTHITTGDVSIKLYSDPGCTVPFTLTSAMSISVAESEIFDNEISGYNNFISNNDYSIPAGVSSYNIVTNATLENAETNYDTNNDSHYLNFNTGYQVTAGIVGPNGYYYVPR